MFVDNNYATAMLPAAELHTRLTLTPPPLKPEIPKSYTDLPEAVKRCCPSKLPQPLLRQFVRLAPLRRPAGPTGKTLL